MTPVLPRRLLVAVVVATLALPSAAEVLDARGLELQLPEGWRPQPPESNMRVAQVVVPGEDGDGQLTIFHFGAGGGGGVDANLERWLSQVELDPGAKPRREKLESPPLTIHFVDAAGTVKASQVGSFPSEDKTGWRLFGAVVEGEGGPWYLRMVGPASTLGPQRDAFLAMLRSAAK